MWTRNISRTILCLALPAVAPAYALAQQVLVEKLAAFALPADEGQKPAVTITQGAAATPEHMPSREILRGVIAAVDQSNDQVTVQLMSDAVANFKVQDGLIFDIVRYGDHVEISVESIGGARTIVGLREE